MVTLWKSELYINVFALEAQTPGQPSRYALQLKKKAHSVCCDQTPNISVAYGEILTFDISESPSNIYRS